MENDVSDLKLAVKREYFEQIKSGKKVFENRLCTEYWKKRLETKRYSKVIITLGYPKKTDTDKIIEFPYVGWERRTITHKHFGDKPVEVYSIILTKNPLF